MIIMLIDIGLVLELEGVDYIFRQFVVIRKFQYIDLYLEVIVKVIIKLIKFILQMEFKLLRKNVQDMYKNELVQYLGN